MAKDFARIERCVNFVIGKPLSLLLYGSWLLVRQAGRGAACLGAWLKKHPLWCERGLRKTFDGIAGPR